MLVLFYFLTKNYKSDAYQHIKVNTKQKLEGLLEEHEAGLLVALMAKVAKADGQVSELEAELLGLTFTDISQAFEESEKIREALKVIYKKEMETFENTIVISKKYLKLTQNEYHKRLKVMEYLLNLAFIDGEFSQTEMMITEDIADAMEIRRADFERLISQFEQFYTARQTQKKLTLQKAYEILGASDTDDFETIKRNIVL